MIKTIYLEVTGLHCPNCPGKIERTISKLHGVNDIKVNSEGNGFVSFSNEYITIQEIQEKIQKMGFQSNVIQNSVK